MCRLCYVEPFLLQEIVQKSLHVHGTGFIHGSLPTSRETRELLIRFAIEEYMERTLHGRPYNPGSALGENAG